MTLPLGIETEMDYIRVTCDKPYTESVGSPPISNNILTISLGGGSQHSPRDTDSVEYIKECAGMCWDALECAR